MSTQSASRPTAQPSAQHSHDPDYLSMAHQEMDNAKALIRGGQMEFRTASLSELARHVGRIRHSLDNASMCIGMERGRDREIVELDFLERDFRTFFARCDLATQKWLHTSPYSIHTGSFDQSTAPNANVKTSFHSCAAIAGEALQVLFSLPPAEVDRCCTSDMIDSVVFNGIKTHGKMLERQRGNLRPDEPAPPVSFIKNPLIEFFPQLKKVPIRPASKPGEINPLKGSDVIKRKEEDSSHDFKDFLGLLESAAQGDCGYPVGAVLEHQGNTYAVALLAPQKIAFIDSHGDTNVAVNTPNAYMITFPSIDKTVQFLSDKFSFDGSDDFADVENDIKFVPILPKTPVLHASKPLAARATSLAPSLMSPRGPMSSTTPFSFQLSRVPSSSAAVDSDFSDFEAGDDKRDGDLSLSRGRSPKRPGHLRVGSGDSAADGSDDFTTDQLFQHFGVAPDLSVDEKRDRDRDGKDSADREVSHVTSSASRLSASVPHPTGPVPSSSTSAAKTEKSKPLDLPLGHPARLVLAPLRDAFKSPYLFKQGSSELGMMPTQLQKLAISHKDVKVILREKYRLELDDFLLESNKSKCLQALESLLRVN